MSSWLGKVLGSTARHANDKRRYPRVSVKGVAVKVDSAQFPVKNLSVGGLLISPYSGDLVERQRFYFTLIFSDGTKEEAFSVDGVVLRRDADGCAAKFFSLRKDCERMINSIIQQVLASPISAPPPRKK